MNAQNLKLFQSELQNTTFKYIGAGFGLVASLAWNEAIKAFIDFTFPLEKNSLLAKFIYAAVMTLLVVVMSLIIIHKKKMP